MAKFICTVKSVLNGRLYNQGEEFVGDKCPNKHFRPEKEVYAKEPEAPKEEETLATVTGKATSNFKGKKAVKVQNTEE